MTPKEQAKEAQKKLVRAKCRGETPDQYGDLRRCRYYAKDLTGDCPYIYLVDPYAARCDLARGRLTSVSSPDGGWR